MTHDTATRRRVLYLTGSLTVAGLAGCTGRGADSADGGGTAETAPATPTDTAGEPDHDDDHEATEEGDHEGDGDHHDDDHEATEEGDHHEETDDHGHDHDEGTPEAPSPTAEVAMRSEGSQHHFDPHVAWVEAGGTVTWRLDRGQHDVVAYHPDNDDKPLRMPEGADPWQFDLLTDEGATVSHTFETEGVYDYYCTPHEGVGMVGTVIVGEPDPHEQPALEEPRASLPEGARAELADLGAQVEEALGHTH